MTRGLRNCNPLNIRRVAGTGFGGLQRLTEKDWPRLVGAMARQECGAVLSKEIINRSYKLYKNMSHEKE